MRTALLLFGFGLALRLLFWLATGDRWESHAAACQGDAPVWQELARASAAGEPHLLLRLPLRPPAMHWLVSSLWDGGADTAWRLRLVFAVLGALVAPLCWLLWRHHLSIAKATFAAVLVAAASNLLTLGSGPHSELPYLVLVLLSLFDQQRLHGAPSAIVATRWGALHGLLCLLRAEHALTFMAFVAVLALQRAPRWPRTAAIALSTFVLALVPWHVVAWRQIDAFNDSEPTALMQPGLSVPGFLPWTPAALQRLATLPKSQQRPMFHFVTATVGTRGGRTVGTDDLDVIRAAYGAWPEPLPRPFVCLYGGLNFFLANSPEADGGFSGGALDRLPPLAANPERFPPGWQAALPGPGTFSPDYLPHLGRLLHGYDDGLAEITADPGGAMARFARKLWHGGEGAASGLGGYALPVGLSGPRRPVDLVLAWGWWPWLYRGALLAVAGLGLWSLRRQRWLWPWLAFAASKAVIVLAFFGYARQGALCVPLLAIGLAVMLARREGTRWIWLLAAALLAVELARCATTDVVRELPNGAAVPAGQRLDHRPVMVRYR